MGTIIRKLREFEEERMENIEIIRVLFYEIEGGRLYMFDNVGIYHELDMKAYPTTFAATYKAGGKLQFYAATYISDPEYYKYNFKKRALPNKKPMKLSRVNEEAAKRILMGKSPAWKKQKYD